MNDHPTLERILDLVLETGPDRELGELQAHIADCETCTDTERWARKLLDAIEEGPPVETPGSLIERARELPRSEPRPRLEAKPAWSMARLIEGAFSRPALAGVRGAGTGNRMLYELEGGHLDLEISPDPDDGENLRLVGQVLFDDRPPPDDTIAMLWSQRRAVARASADAAGLFIFTHVPPGVYGLDLLSLSVHRAVRIAQVTVELGEP